MEDFGFWIPDCEFFRTRPDIDASDVFIINSFYVRMTPSIPHHAVQYLGHVEETTQEEETGNQPNSFCTRKEEHEVFRRRDRDGGPRRRARDHGGCDHRDVVAGVGTRPPARIQDAGSRIQDSGPTRPPAEEPQITQITQMATHPMLAA